MSRSSWNSRFFPTRHRRLNLSSHSGGPRAPARPMRVTHSPGHEFPRGGGGGRQLGVTLDGALRPTPAPRPARPVQPRLSRPRPFPLRRAYVTHCPRQVSPAPEDRKGRPSAGRDPVTGSGISLTVTKSPHTPTGTAGMAPLGPRASSPPGASGVGGRQVAWGPGGGVSHQEESGEPRGHLPAVGRCGSETRAPTSQVGDTSQNRTECDVGWTDSRPSPPRGHTGPGHPLPGSSPCALGSASFHGITAVTERWGTGASADVPR